jgi:hypothetical protein
MDWMGENNWAAPLITLIPKIIHLIKHQGATTSIVALVWKGCHWWADLNALSINKPVPIPNNKMLFNGNFSVQPEPLHNCWRCWTVFWICGWPGPVDGHQEPWLH